MNSKNRKCEYCSESLSKWRAKNKNVKFHKDCYTEHRKIMNEKYRKTRRINGSKKNIYI